MNVSAPTISAPQAARLLKVSDERVRQLVRGGYIERASHGRYPLVSVVQGYIRYRNDRRQKMEDAASSPLMEAKLAEIQRRMAREDATLVDMREALECYDTMTGMLIEMIESLPPLITKDPDELRRITTIVNAEVRRLKAAFARIRHNLKTGQENYVEAEDE